MHKWRRALWETVDDITFFVAALFRWLQKPFTLNMLMVQLFLDLSNSDSPLGCYSASILPQQVTIASYRCQRRRRHSMGQKQKKNHLTVRSFDQITLTNLSTKCWHEKSLSDLKDQHKVVLCLVCPMEWCLLLWHLQKVFLIAYPGVLPTLLSLFLGVPTWQGFFWAWTSVLEKRTLILFTNFPQIP